MIEKQQIVMSEGCRYMSEYSELMDYLPVKGWYVLNKTLCGCGGTTVFLESDRDIILVSPRINMLKSKHKQYPNTHLFGELRSARFEDRMERLRDYIAFGNNPSFLKHEPRKIMVTIDSYKHVASVLSYMGRMDKYLTVVDECQCLMGDASLKGNVELEFLETLKRTTPNVCFMSATPIPVEYLEWVDYFENIPYYQLVWDPNVMESPNLKPNMMKRDESARTICRRIIEDFRENGFFKSKVWNGEIVYSREICVFLNDVSEIIRIIKDNNLQPEEVSILCSEYAGKRRELEAMGFRINEQCTDREHPRNKTFTFLTSASFEGMDMYSDNAYTVAFFNAHKEWETHDISIDLPQIMARQRLESNPFKRDAEVLYKTKSQPKTREEIEKEMEEMRLKSLECIDDFNNATTPRIKEMIVKNLRNVIPSERYKDYFLDVVDMGESGYALKLNMMVILAHLNLWAMQNYYYKNPILLVKGAYDKLANNYKDKPDSLMTFEQNFYKSNSFSDRLRLYTDYRDAYPDLAEALEINPHIDINFHRYYDLLGGKRIKELDFRKNAIEDECMLISSYPKIQDLCMRRFVPGEFYSNAEIKSTLSEIYAYLNIPKAPSAIDITRFLDAEPKNMVNQDGTRIKGFLIVGG